jgi:hypothetical protein
MSKIALAVLIAVLGVVMWLALKARYEVRGVGRRFLGIWRKDPHIREATIFSLALMASCVIFALLPGLLS